MLNSTHIGNIKKTRKTITLTEDTKKLSVCQNIPLTGHKDSIKNHPVVEKVVLPIRKIFQNYFSIESSEGTKQLKTIFRMPHDILFQLRPFLFFWNFKANYDIN